MKQIETALQRCQDNPGSADFGTCMGMDDAMDYDVYESMEAADTAVNLDETRSGRL